MKKLILFALFILISFYGFSQNTAYYDRMEHIFGNIDKTKVTTGFLKEFGIRFNEVEAYNGTIASDNFVDKIQLQSLYSSLYTMRVGTAEQDMVAPNLLFRNLGLVRGIKFPRIKKAPDVLLSALHYNYQQYKSDAYIDGDVTINNGSIHDVPGRNPYDTKTAFAAGPLKQELQGNTFSFKMPSNFIYTNSTLNLNQVQVNFGNGQGYQTLTLNTIKNVNYSSGGEKEIKIKFQYDNGTTLYSHSKIWVDYIPDSSALQARFKGIDITTQSISGDNWQGSSATGFITTELAQGHEQLTKPLIVVEGFDPENSFDYFDLINKDNPGGLKVEINNSSLTLNQAIEDEGYDLVFVNFANSTDYIQRNALMVEAVIDWVNEEKEDDEKNVVLGMSMGGLVARYALRDMELNNETHETKLYISHDAPHQGANVPLAYQAMVRHLVGEQVSYPVFLSLIDVNFTEITDLFPDLEDGLDLLKTPAARQMLIYQLQGTGENISVDNNTLHDSFVTEYSNMGYPQKESIRNIAISNGSECGTPLNFDPYDNLVDVNEKIDLPNFLANIGLAVVNGFTHNPSRVLTSILSTDTDIKAQFNAKALPNQQSKRIYKGKVFIEKTILFLIDVEEPFINEGMLNSSTSMLPIDNNNGGIYDLEAFIDLPAEVDSYVKQKKFNFIPTYSSLDIGNGDENIIYSDLTKAYSPLAPPLAPKNIPFDNFFTNPITSKGHTQFTLKNGNWLMDELDDDNTPAFYSDISICSSAELPLFITGEADRVCYDGSSTFELLNLNPNATVTWSVSSNLTILSSTTTSVTVKAINNSVNGEGTISATVNGYQINKSVWIGKPTISVTSTPHNSPPNPSFYLKIDNIQAQGANQVQWTKTGGNGSLSQYGKRAYVHGPPSGWRVQYTISVTNDCGTTEKSSSIGGGNGFEFDDGDTELMRLNSQDVYKVYDKVKGTYNIPQLKEIEVFDINGNPVMSTQNNRVDLSDRKPGIYIIQTEVNGKREITKIIK